MLLTARAGVNNNLHRPERFLTTVDADQWRHSSSVETKRRARQIWSNIQEISYQSYGSHQVHKRYNGVCCLDAQAGTDTVHLDGGRAGKVAVTDETGVTGDTGQVPILPSSWTKLVSSRIFILDLTYPIQKPIAAPNKPSNSSLRSFKKTYSYLSPGAFICFPSSLARTLKLSSPMSFASSLQTTPSRMPQP